MSQKSTGFVSEMDQFLQGYDKKHPELSASQRKEQAKFQRIYRLRDVADGSAPKKPIDDWFNNNE